VSRFRLVIFDYDGTLADSGQWFADNINRFARKHRFREVSTGELEQLRALPTRDVIRALEVKWWRMPLIAADMRRAVGEPGGTPRLFEGVGALLRRTKTAGIRIGVVSSNSELNIRVGLGAELAALIDGFACGAGLFAKSAKLRRLARRMEVPDSAVLCVGDDSRDIEAAHAVGLKGAAVTWGYAREEAFTRVRPDFVVRSIDELAGVLGV
jgi:phosphoglycolate phosphatase